MTEMIERVARALCARHYSARFGGPSTDPHIQMNVDASWRVFEGEARAAIEAMREPTEEMVDVFAEAAAETREAAREENRRLNRANPNAIAECQWFPPAYRAMIDAVLSSGTSS